MQQDRNFDDLAERFNARIYDTLKGQLRLDILKQDLHQFTQTTSLNVWDAGCGAGQISLWLAGFGHQMTLCDISGKLLAQAQQHFAEAKLQARFHHTSIQMLSPQLNNFDLVICHAVVEWLASPLETLKQVMDRVKTGGYLSLMFYNRNAMVYKNVIRGGWRLEPILNDRYIGIGNKLSPPFPLYPNEIIQFLQNNGFEIIQHSGIRVFSDYLNSESRNQTNEQELLALEHQYCRMPTYRDMGRYVHLLIEKKSPD
ncbi:methyltransferase domain-containing protein [Methylophaga sp. UBA5100]|uniref:methyltransferase domain-containing protein n=1 Tax=Methylophaga sp. UBA5100 TaxID=1946899 RepID=UPI0025D214DD|nr:methyltransferase domain-containing protein [Methylophaga sp. UBA5100]